MPHPSRTTASIALVTGGALWGLYWIPVRFFQEAGLDGPWPGVVMYLAALLILIPLAYRDAPNILRNARQLLLSGVFTGAAFGLYSLSLVYTEVVRSILLFYLTPIWGVLLGMLFLGERLTLGRILGLVLGLGGLLIVLGEGTAIPLPRNAGDWLALCSGIAWAVGSMGLYQARGTPVSGQAGAFVLGALAISAVSLVVHPVGLPEAMETKVGVLALLSALYIVPMIFLTIWPATMLSPARVGLLLMSEVVVGLFTAALWSGEAFGWREGLGAALIVGAAVWEILGADKGSPAANVNAPPR